MLKRFRRPLIEAFFVASLVLVILGLLFATTNCFLHPGPRMEGNRSVFAHYPAFYLPEWRDGVENLVICLTEW